MSGRTVLVQAVNVDYPFVAAAVVVGEDVVAGGGLEAGRVMVSA